MYLWWIGIFLSDFIKYLLGMIVFFNFKVCRKKVWAAIIGAAGYLVLLAGGVVSEGSPILLSLPIVLMLVFLMLDGNWKGKTVPILKCTFIIICIDEIIAMLFKSTVNSVNTDHFVRELYYIVGNIIIIIVIILIRFIMNRFSINLSFIIKSFYQRFLYILIMITAISLIFAAVGLAYTTNYVDNPYYITFANMISITSLIGILLFGGLMMYINNLNKRIESSLKTERFLKRTQEDYYQLMLKEQEDTRRFRHDINNHLMCMSELIKKKDIKRLEDYINDLSQEIQKINNGNYSVRNNVIDIMLNHYLNQLIHTNIRVTGYCMKEIDISEVDLCTIFSNILQNAVEELNNQKEENNKFIQIDVASGEESVKVTVVNHVINKNNHKDNRNPGTWKDDKKNHGIGLKNVRDIVEKNKGNFDCRISGNSFIAEIILPYKEE